MKNVDVEKTLKQTIKKHGADGLCRYECGCSVNDLAPCGGIQLDCELALEGYSLDKTDKEVIYAPMDQWKPYCENCLKFVYKSLTKICSECGKKYVLVYQKTEDFGIDGKIITPYKHNE